MRKTWAEYKREARQKQREERRALEDLAVADLRTPFFEDFEQFKEFDPAWYAAVLGKDWFAFDDDSGIKPEDDEALIKVDIDRAGNSLAKAEFLISHFMDLTGQLASAVNGYKRREFAARIVEIEASDMSEPDAKKKAFAEVARLKKMRDQLDKQVRWTFPQWKVTGE